MREFFNRGGFKNITPKTNEDLRYPYILKKKIGAWGEEISVISDSCSERSHVKQIESEDYFRQEYIEGHDEYTTHIIINDGTIVFARTIKFTFAEMYFVKGKHFKETRREVVDHGHLNNLFQKILNKIDYQGTCCFNYKIVEGTVKLFEINPRFGGSMPIFMTEALIAYRGALAAWRKTP